MVKNKSKSIEIIQDTREPEMQIIVDVNNLDIKFKREFMKVGDYKCGNVLVERKTISDFSQSILDGRIETQVEAMKKSGKECFIVVVGHVCDRGIDIHENCILGKMVSLVVKHKMKVLFCEDEFQFMYLLRNIIEKCGENEM